MGTYIQRGRERTLIDNSREEKYIQLDGLNRHPESTQVRIINFISIHSTTAIVFILDNAFRYSNHFQFNI